MLELPPVGAVVEIVQTFDSGMVATFRGTITAIEENTGRGVWSPQNPRSHIVTLGGTHRFGWLERQQPSGVWCTMAVKVLSVPVVEPPDKTMLLVVDGLVRTVWVRCDADAKRYKPKSRWRRTGATGAFTWDELLRETKGKKLIKLRGERPC